MAPLPGSPKRPLQGALLQPVEVAHLRRRQRLRQCVELHDAEPRTRAERKSQVRQCLGFCTADFYLRRQLAGLYVLSVHHHQAEEPTN